MQKFRNRMLFMLASAFSLSVLAVAPVWAQHGLDDSTANAETPTTSEDSSTSDTSTEHSSTTLREEARQLLATKRANAKEHTTEQKQKSCEAHKAEIDKRVANYSAAAQRHLDVFNSIFTKVQAFHDNKQLNVASYDSLVATAKEKQTAAQTAVDALKALNVNIDCSQSDPATSVAAIKTATKNARTALHEYRKAIKDVVVALKGASTGTKDSSTSDTTKDTTTNTNTTGGTQ